MSSSLKGFLCVNHLWSEYFKFLKINGRIYYKTFLIQTGFSKQHFWCLWPRLFEVNAFQDWLIQIRELCSTKYDNFREILKDISNKNHLVKWQEYKIWNFLRRGYALYGTSHLVTTTPTMSRRNPSLHSAYWGQILSKIAKYLEKKWVGEIHRYTVHIEAKSFLKLPKILRRNELAKFIVTQCTIGSQIFLKE